MAVANVEYRVVVVIVDPAAELSYVERAQAMIEGARVPAALLLRIVDSASE